jgi:Ca2+-transporting ATPase
MSHSEQGKNNSSEQLAKRIRPWHSLDTETVLRHLEVNAETGLNREEVKRRLVAEGYNELTVAGGVSPFALLLGQFRSILIIVLVAAAAFSALVGGMVDAVIILIIVLFSALLGFVQEYRAERAVGALKRMLSPTVSVLRDGNTLEVASRELVRGDIVLLEAGNRVAADIRLIEAHSLRCDEASLTGESAPVAKQTEALPHDTGVPERNNTVFGGTTITYGRGRGIVTETGMQSELGHIASEVAAVEVGDTPLEKRTAEIGKWLAVISLSVCALVAVISVIRGALADSLDLNFVLTMTLFAVALAVAAVPEALAAIVTGALAIGMRSLAKRNAIVKRMPAVETLGCTTVICCDKTGTLTRGEMTIRRILCSTRMVEIDGAGYTTKGSLHLPEGITEHDQSLRLLLQAGLLCNDSELVRDGDRWTIKGDPTEAAFLVAAKKAGIDIADTRTSHRRIGEVPFSSERKRMTTTHIWEGNIAIAFMKGAPETVIAHCNRIADGDSVREFSGQERALILENNAKMAGDALRVLALAYRELDDSTPGNDDELESDMIFLGLAGMMDPPRAEALAAVETCKQVGIRTVMITGDHELTATAIAHELGIHGTGNLVVKGDDLADMSVAELEQIVERVTVYARVSPMDKLKIVRAWKAKGQVVAMTGDGVNDAPALKHADIGVAMGVAGTDVAREAADMILTDDNFSTIVNAIKQGRWIYDNIKKYLAYLLESNIAEVVVIGGIVLLMGPDYLPLLPAAILYLNLATDGLPALALGVAPPDPDIMARPPRRPDESAFGWDVKSFILRAVVIEVPIYLWIFFSHIDDLEHARTMLFFMFVSVELVIALNCRSLVYSIFSAPPHKWLIIALAWELALIAILVQIPAVRQAFGITVPSAANLALVAAIGLSIMVVIETSKILLRRYMANTVSK